MSIKAVVFDIGGVLEITPETGWTERWETHLHLEPGELDKRLMHIWKSGSRGQISEAEMEKNVGELLGINSIQLDAFLSDLWEEYLGTLNVEMATYFSSLRPRYRTAILSNSFVGAREREQKLYHFAEMTDLIIYSHEVGVAKPEKRIFELTCEQLGVQPEEMIFLDDVALIVNAARELGIHALLFQETAQAIADVEACLKASVS